MTYTRFIIYVVSLFLLYGCSVLPKLDDVLPDSRSEYKKSETLPDLEIPPDLTADTVNESMAIPGEQGATTLSEFEQQRAQRDFDSSSSNFAALKDYPDEQWLAIQGATTEIWPKLSEFWSAKGYTLDLDDAELGVLETNWLEHAAGDRVVRDKFKIFSEPGGDPGSTVLFISNEREEKITREDGSVEWLGLDKSIEQEKNIVGELNLHFYGKDPTASAGAGQTTSGSASTVSPASSRARPPRKKAEMISAGEGKTYLAIPEEYTRAWRHTELALQRAGILIEGSDQEKGLYYVLYFSDEKSEEKKGLLKKLKFWGNDEPEGKEYHISLTGVGDKTELIVLNTKGDWESGDDATRILMTIQNVYNQ
ncbi:MAG: outer membrane protein assembly factor BamC [Gammaproteobacteria bacterium]